MSFHYRENIFWWIEVHTQYVMLAEYSAKVQCISTDAKAIILYLMNFGFCFFWLKEIWTQFFFVCRRLRKQSERNCKNKIKLLLKTYDTLQNCCAYRFDVSFHPFNTFLRFHNKHLDYSPFRSVITPWLTMQIIQVYSLQQYWIQIPQSNHHHHIHPALLHENGGKRLLPIRSIRDHFKIPMEME